MALRDTRQIVRYDKSQIGVWINGGSPAAPGMGVEFAVRMALQSEFGQAHLQNFGQIQFTEFCEIVRDRATIVIQAADEGT